MNEVVVIDQISIEFRDRLTQLEARLDNISDDQLGDAMQWMREQQASLNLHNSMVTNVQQQGL